MAQWVTLTELGLDLDKIPEEKKFPGYFTEEEDLFAVARLLKKSIMQIRFSSDEETDIKTAYINFKNGTSTDVIVLVHLSEGGSGMLSSSNSERQPISFAQLPESLRGVLITSKYNSVNKN